MEALLRRCAGWPLNGGRPQQAKLSAESIPGWGTARAKPVRQERALACWGDTKASVPETCRPKRVGPRRRPERLAEVRSHRAVVMVRNSDFNPGQWEDTGAAQPTRSQMGATYAILNFLVATGFFLK